jgi:hypothetical protein
MPRIVLDLPPDSLRANRRSGQDWRNVLKEKRQYMADCQTRALLQRAEWQGFRVQYPTHLRAIVYLGRTLTGKRRQTADSPDVGY